MKKICEASVEIFGGCNYKCMSCPQSEGREKEFLQYMDLKLFKRIVEDLKLHGCRSVALQGSGEPLLHSNVHEFVSILSESNIRSQIITNGSNLTKTTAGNLFKAGLTSLRVSILGSNEQDYQKNMGTKYTLESVINNIENAASIAKSINSNCKISVYHLILNSDIDIESQIKIYKSLTSHIPNIGVEIWHAHNWAGSSPLNNNLIDRFKGEKRSCGRPQAEYLTVRAGGINGRKAAVVPCCFVLGSDSKAVLGHLDTMTIQEVLDSKLNQELLKAHELNDYKNIEYCMDCDQLYKCQDALVWTNLEERKNVGSTTNHTGNEVGNKSSFV